MKIDEFLESVKFLEVNFGQTLSEDQKKMWFEEFKGMKSTLFRYLITECNRQLHFFPKLADVIELKTKINFKEVEPEPVKTLTKEECRVCNSKGFVLFDVYDEELENTYTYIARCTCSNSKEYENCPSIKRFMGKKNCSMRKAI